MESPADIDFGWVPETIELSELQRLNPELVFLKPDENGAFDHFSFTLSGWSNGDNDTASTAYVDGKYHVIVKQEVRYNMKPYLWPDYADVSIEIDIDDVKGNASYFGVFCRKREDHSYYKVLLSPQKFEGIIRSKNLFGTEVGMARNYSLFLPNQTNHLRVDCVGNQIRVFLNDFLVAEYIDPDNTPGSGLVGLISGSKDGSQSEFIFDNFSVVTDLDAISVLPTPAEEMIAAQTEIAQEKAGENAFSNILITPKFDGEIEISFDYNVDPNLSLDNLFFSVWPLDCDDQLTNISVSPSAPDSYSGEASIMLSLKKPGLCESSTSEVISFYWDDPNEPVYIQLVELPFRMEKSK